MAVPLVSQTARHPLGLSRAPSGSQCALEVAHDTIPELDPPQGPARMRGGGHPACPCAQQPSLPLGTGSVSSPSGPQSHHLSAPGVSGIFGIKEALSPVPPKREPCVPSILGLLSDTGTRLHSQEVGWPRLERRPAGLPGGTVYHMESGPGCMLRSIFKSHSCCWKLLTLPEAKTALLRPRTPQLVGVKRGPGAKLNQTWPRLPAVWPWASLRLSGPLLLIREAGLSMDVGFQGPLTSSWHTAGLGAPHCS